MSILRLMMKGRVDRTPPGPPTEFGQPYGGGFYAGIIKIGTKNYRVIVADKAAEAPTIQWKTVRTNTPAVSGNWNDGATNTANLPGPDFPAAEHCRNYTGGGYDDWYLPSRDELELAYRNLKPFTAVNSTATRSANAGGETMGVNPNSVPVGVAYTTTVPAQTAADAFRIPDGAQAFNTGGKYWTSSGSLSTNGTAVTQGFSAGGQTIDFVDLFSGYQCRPFRKEEIVIPPVEPPGPIGSPYQGGFYVGQIRIDGQDYYLVVAEKLSTVARAWKATAALDDFPFTMNDGLTNSNFINDAAHPAAQYCRAYAGGGFNDWYLPSRDELEVCYRNVKPTSQTNNTSIRGADAGGGAMGLNENSVPPGAAYSSAVPGIAADANWRAPGGGQYFVISPGYWSSTQSPNVPTPGGALAILQSFYDGNQFGVDKTNPTGQVRPMRRIPIPPSE